MIRRNTVEKWLGVQKPTTCEMWAMDSVGAASNLTARSIRSRTTNRCGGSPRAVLEATGKVIRAHGDHRTEVRQRQILIERRLDMLDHPPQF